MKSHEELAAKIARAIMETGDEPKDKAWRIEFKGGFLGDETSLGGLNEKALARIICRALDGGTSP